MIQASILWLSDEYRALNEFRRGDFSSSLRTCSAVLKLHNQKTAEGVRIFCSEPFSLLLDGDLKQIILRSISLEQRVSVHPHVVMLYLRLRCMLELRKESREIAPFVNEIKVLSDSWAGGSVDSEILNFIRQKLLTICTDIQFAHMKRIT